MPNLYWNIEIFQENLVKYMGKFIKSFRKSNKRQSFLYKIFQISGYLKIFYPSNLISSLISVNCILCRTQVIMIMVYPKDKKALIPMLIFSAILGIGVAIAGAKFIG